MALIKKGVQAALDKARADHAACEVRIGELNEQKRTLLADDGTDADAVVAIEKRIADEGGKLTVLGARIESLMLRLDAELAERVGAEYRVKVDTVEKAIPLLTKAAGEFKSALEAVANSIDKLALAQQSFIRSHATGLLLPGDRCSMARIERALKAAFTDFDRRGADRLDHIREVAANFLGAEIQGYGEHLETLRSDRPSEPAHEEAA
jgi:hypothetical protein